MKPWRTLRAQRVMGNSFVLKAATESFAVPAGSAVKLKIKPRRAQRTRRVRGKSVNMNTVTTSFAYSACSAVKLKIKPRRTPRTQRGWRKVEQVVFIKIFACSANSAVN